MYDVIIAGGGPAGSYTAYRLAEQGHSVLVLERHRRAGEAVCCTGIIGRECADVFGIGDEVILRQANGASLYSPAGTLLHVQRDKPQACIIDRAAFDAAMAERARGAGAEFRFESRVTDIVAGTGGVTVQVSCRGTGETLQTKATVVATGFTPGLLRRLGLGDFKDYTVGAQAEVAAPGCEEVEVYFGDMAPGFFGWIVPTSPPMARVGLMCRRKPGYYLKNWMAQLAVEGKIASAEADIRYGGIPLKPLPRSYGERMLVVGDAAGQVKPTSGGGIYYGLIGAELAAATLHDALADGDLSAKRLSRYEREWRKKLGRELRVGYWARKLYEHIGNRRVDRLFEMVKSRGIDRAMLGMEDLSFDWHSRTILTLAKRQVAVQAMNLLKLPLRVAGFDRQRGK